MKLKKAKRTNGYISVALVLMTFSVVRAQQARPGDSMARIQQIAVTMHISEEKARELYGHFSVGRQEADKKAKAAQEQRAEALKRNLLARRKTDSVKYRAARAKAANIVQNQQQVKAALKRAKQIKVTPKPASHVQN